MMHRLSKLITKLLLITILGLVVSACGFHLRGTFLMPTRLQQLTINSDQPYHPLIGELEQQLQQAHVQIQTQPQAKYVLHVNHIKFSSQQISSTQSLNLQTQFLLTLQAIVSLTTSSATHFIIHPRPLSVQQIFTYNQNKIQSSQADKLLLIKQLQQQLAKQIINVLASKQTLKQLNQS